MTARLHDSADDLVPLAAIHAACFPDPWDAGALADLLAIPGTFAMVADGGFILARAAGGEGEILTLAVDPISRRRGIGTELVAAAAARAAEMGASALFLEVAVANGAARALYVRLGFAQAGRRKAYYAPRGAEPQDALILRSNLPLAPLGKSAPAG